jgi:transposase
LGVGPVAAPTVFSLAELNAAIRELIADLNDRPMRHLGTSRRALFEALEQTALLPLPAEPYVYAEWRRCRAGLDYHVEVHGHFYSVPYRLMRETIEARITDQTVELFHAGVRVAGHPRNPRQHRHTTIPEHMPSSHRLVHGAHRIELQGESMRKLRAAKAKLDGAAIP